MRRVLKLTIMGESTIDLILKGHFENLKQRANNESIQPVTDELREVLNEILDYLKGTNDQKSKDLYQRLIEILPALDKNTDNILAAGKKPMKKAGKKKNQGAQKRAM